MTKADIKTAAPQPDDDSARRLIYGALLPNIRQGIEEGVEDEKNNVRQGNVKNNITGIEWLDKIIDMIFGMIFQLAEALGFEKQLANLVGKHIPEENEKDAIAVQVTKSITTVLTAKDKDGKLITESMSKEDIEAAVHAQIKSDLEKNSEITKILNSEQIEKIAALAGSRIGGNIGDIRQLNNPEEKISSLMADRIKENIAQKVLEKYKGGGITGWFTGNKAVKEAAEIMDKYKDNPPVTPEQIAEVKKAQHALYMRAVEKNMAPNNAQRERIGDIVAKTAMDMLKDPKNLGMSQESLAKAMQNEIEKNLKAEKASIDKLGVAVDTMDYTYIPGKANGDMLGDIAKGIGEEIRNPKDSKIYDMMTMMQSSFAEGSARQVASTMDRTGLTTGLVGKEAQLPEGRAATPANERLGGGLDLRA